MTNLSIKRDVSPDAAQTAMQKAAEETRDAVRQRREEMMAKARAEAQAIPLAVEEEVDETPREDLDSVTLTLPCGEVEFGPPPGVSLTVRVATFPDAPSRGNVLLRVLMCVRSIDGKPVRPLANMVDVQRLANIIGDQYLDVLAELYNQYWPPLSVRDLPTIKKNPR